MLFLMIGMVSHYVKKLCYFQKLSLNFGLQKIGPSSPISPVGSNSDFSRTLTDAILSLSTSAVTRRIPFCIFKMFEKVFRPLPCGADKADLFVFFNENKNLK